MRKMNFWIIIFAFFVTSFTSGLNEKSDRINNRLMLFWKNHKIYHNRLVKLPLVKYKIRSRLVRKTLCNAMTCGKCLTTFTYQGEDISKMEHYCTVILTLPECCMKVNSDRKFNFA